jgi:hypothetical protein
MDCIQGELNINILPQFRISLTEQYFYLHIWIRIKHTKTGSHLCEKGKLKLVTILDIADLEQQYKYIQIAKKYGYS